MSKTEISIRIEKKGELPGSVGWLAATAAAIKLGTATDGSPSAWLLDKDGGTIDVLVSIDGEMGMMRLVNSSSECDVDELACSYSYTDAAWAVMEQFITAAQELLEEPTELAEAYAVVIRPKDELFLAMLKAAKDDPAARAALIDYVNNAGQ